MWGVFFRVFVYFLSPLEKWNEKPVYSQSSDRNIKMLAEKEPKQRRKKTAEEGDEVYMENN